MIIKWTSTPIPKTIEKPLWTKFCGLKFYNQRPDEIYLTISETHELLSSEHFISYGIGVLSKMRKN